MHKKVGSLNKLKKNYKKLKNMGGWEKMRKKLKKAHVQISHIVYVFVYGKIAINK